MSWRARFIACCRLPVISWFDLVFMFVLIIGGLFYLRDFLYWGVGWIGESPYGDAEFWWNGALNIGEGFFQELSKGLRPGYFILTGLTLPVVGNLFSQYYLFFLILFLTATSLFYLSLRPFFGRWAASCATAMFIFNPFTAEWLATPTTDGTGLLLHVIALASLLIGVNKHLKKSWLIVFGIFFSLATLTRPLLTPFILIVLFSLFFFRKENIKKRLNIILFVVIAFSTPTFLWMATQKIMVNEWTLSSNDAASFYAASDPAIQVWDGPMYHRVQELAAKKHHIDVDKVDMPLLNQTYWEETKKNYINNAPYHFSRIAPHVWEIARFSPEMATHGTESWRSAFFIIMTAGMSLFFLMSGRLFRAALFLTLTGIQYFYSSIFLYMTLSGAALALLSAIRGRIGVFLLGTYWLTGVIALYFVGGTWGTPSFTALFDLNALGYRLGSQFFFVGDMLAVYFLVCFAYLKLDLNSQNKLPIIGSWGQQFMINPSLFTSAIVLVYAFLFTADVTLIYLVGGYKVFYQAYARAHSNVEVFPSTDLIKKWYVKHVGKSPLPAATQSGGLTNVPPKNADILFMGVISPFIWNLQGQNRAQLKVYSQDQLYPFTMGTHSIFLDIPQHIAMKKWVGKRGAFIIRQLADNHNISNLPYYLTTPQLRAFFPLTADGKQYDLAHALWFPLVKNATQLESNHELQIKNSQVIWAQNSGPAPFKRRFFIAPQNNKQAMKIILPLKKTNYPLRIAFDYLLGEEPEATLPPEGQYDLNVDVIADKLKHSILTFHHTFTNKKAIPFKEINIAIPKNTKAVEITFRNLPPKTGVWLYEFNLIRDDFIHFARN